MKKYSSVINITIITLLLVGLGLSSTIVPYLAAGSNRVFAGFHGYSADYVGYVSYIKEGMYGHYAMNFRSFPPVQPATPIHWEYILAGIIFSPFHIEAPAIYHLLRCILGILFVLSTYTLFKTLLGKKHHALLATIIAFTSSCIGWFSYTNGSWQTQILNYFPFFISTPQRVVDRPHYILGSVLFLWAFGYLIREKTNRKIVVLLFILSFLTIMVHVSSGIVLACISGVLILLSYMLKGPLYETKIDRYNGLAIIAGSSIAAGVSYYFIQQYSAVSDIFLDKYTYSAGLTLTTIWREILSFGPLLWLGLTGLIANVFYNKNASLRTRILMLAWGCIHLLLFFFLYPLFRVDQVRFVQSLYFIPLSFGVIWLLWHIAKLTRIWIFSIGICLLFISTFPTYLTQLDHDIHDMTDYSSFAPFGFPTQNQFAAYKYLDAHTPIESTVLAQYDAANMILLYSHNLVLGNDQGWTPQGGAQMQQEVTTFLTGNLGDDRAYTYLSSNHVKYIYWGYREKSFGNITRYTFLQKVYENPEVSIFKVK